MTIHDPGAEAAWAAERALLFSEIRRDGVTLETLLAVEFHEIGESGRHWSRNEVVDALAAEPADDERATLSERRADRVAADVILLTYRLDFADRSSRRGSLWRVSPDGPRLLFHQGTPVPPASGA